MLKPKQVNEIADLARRYGMPHWWSREYAIATKDSAAWVRRIAKRRGEVVLVVRRSGGRVLLHCKSNYPAGVYRLPSGGVNPRETVERALKREAYEEIGIKIEHARFIGLVENVFKLAKDEISYPSYVFVTPIVKSEPRVLDADEEISGFNEIPLAELARVAAQLDALPPDWQPWGKFRAAPHALVLKVLQTNHSGE